MAEYKWATPETLRELLNELVSWKSVTLSEGEKHFPVKLKTKLAELDYFQQFPDRLQLHQADLGRTFLTALYQHPDAKKTICLISHFDTVNTEEYGDTEAIATQPEELTRLFAEQKATFPGAVCDDLASGNYLFGRGTMDMKAGLAIHMHLLEKASTEQWPVNLLLLTVPDEEVNSAGMRCAVPVLLEMRARYDLEYTLFLNSEPVFTLDPHDEHHYLYTGTMGKVLPAALFYGKETHAGEPLSGMTSPYIASYLTREMEFNRNFQETVSGETTPLPVTLQQRDLTAAYSTQTPYRSSALYNVFLMKRNASEIFDLFERTAENAAAKLNQDYAQICRENQVDPIGKVSVIRYEKLLTYAKDKWGADFIEKVKADVQLQNRWDEREKSLRIADKLMIACQELAPAMVLLLAPPYYPAVNVTGEALAEKCTDFVIQKANEQFGLTMNRVHYFNGLCDLSYLRHADSGKDQHVFAKNAPVWNDSYTIPFEEIAQLSAPVLNIGPFGKDAHKRTERLHVKNAFEELPVLLEEMIHMLAHEQR